MKPRTKKQPKSKGQRKLHFVTGKMEMVIVKTPPTKS